MHDYDGEDEPIAIAYTKLAGYENIKITAESSYGEKIQKTMDLGIYANTETKALYWSLDTLDQRLNPVKGVVKGVNQQISDSDLERTLADIIMRTFHINFKPVEIIEANKEFAKKLRADLVDKK